MSVPASCAARRFLRFTKMQGVGNDFVVVDATADPFRLTSAQIRVLADRRFGVGCDQVLVVEKAPRDDVDFGYRIFNADGGEVGQCGNGARCFVVFVRAKGLTDKRAIRVATLSGVIVPRLEASGEVSVDMGAPRFDPAAVPFVGGTGQAVESLALAGRTLEVSVLSMGNPHAVQVVDDVDAAPVGTEGPLIERHARFPERVNAGYMQVIDRATIRLRVYERGAGETLACGTGACAAVVAGRRRDMLDETVSVQARGGVLTVRWAGEAAGVVMTGPAAVVFDGEWPVPE